MCICLCSFSLSQIDVFCSYLCETMKLFPRYHGSCLFEWQSSFLGVVQQDLGLIHSVSYAVAIWGRNRRRNNCFDLSLWHILFSLSQLFEATCLRMLFSLNPQNLLRMWSWYINQCLCSREDWSTRETGAISTLYPFHASYFIVLLTLTTWLLVSWCYIVIKPNGPSLRARVSL